MLDLFTHLRLTTALSGFGVSIAPDIPIAPIGIAQTAVFGDTATAGAQGWRPQLASGAVDDLASYDALWSGDAGAFAGQVVNGALSFTGGTGAPNGTVHAVTGVSGREYLVTIDERADTEIIASKAEWDAYGRGVGLEGKEVRIRQDAQISPSLRAGLFNQDGGGALDAFRYNPPTLIGEGAQVGEEYHLDSWALDICPALILRDIKFRRAAGMIMINGRNPRYFEASGCHFTGFVLDKENPVHLSTLQNSGYAELAGSTPRGFYCNTGGIDVVRLIDNTFEDYYLPLEIIYNHRAEYIGNDFARIYFDAIKDTPADGATTFVGGNYGHTPTGRGAAGPGGYADDPHHDFFQWVGGSQTPGVPRWVDFEMNFFVEGTDQPANAHCFLADSNDTDGAGKRVRFAGNVTVTDGPYSLSIDYPDAALYEYNCALPYRRETDPLALDFKIGLFLGRLKDNRTTLGNSSMFVGDVTSRHNVDFGVRSAIVGIAVNSTDDVNLDGLTTAQIRETLPNYRVPEMAVPNRAQLLQQAVASGADKLGSVLTLGAKGSDYIADETAFPVPTLGVPSVTPLPGGADIVIGTDQLHPPLVYVVSTSPTADVEDVLYLAQPTERHGAAYVAGDASAPFSYAVSLSGLEPGITYYLHAVVPVGKRSTAVRTASFVPASVTAPTTGDGSVLSTWNFTGNASPNKTIPDPGGTGGIAVAISSFGGVTSMSRGGQSGTKVAENVYTSANVEVWLIPAGTGGDISLVSNNTYTTAATVFDVYGALKNSAVGGGHNEQTATLDMDVSAGDIIVGVGMHGAASTVWNGIAEVYDVGMQGLRVGTMASGVAVADAEPLAISSVANAGWKSMFSVAVSFAAPPS